MRSAAAFSGLLIPSGEGPRSRPTS